MTETAALTTSFSLAERDRRWLRVRQLMAGAGLDVIVVPPHTGHHDHFSANARYLSGLGGFSYEVGVVFPIAGDVTAITVPDIAPAKWRMQQDWVADIRSSGRAFGDAIIARLHELPALRRIGLAGLNGLPRFADGIVPQHLYAALSRAFPNAELVDCTNLLDTARYVKSAEEIAFLRRGVALAEDAVRALYTTARPGITECAVYGKMIEAMVAQGGELPTMIMWTAGAPGPSLGAAPPGLRPLARGDMIRVEVEGRWAGYCGQVTQMASLGAPDMAFRDLANLQNNALHVCLEKMRPGISLGELAHSTEAVVRGSRHEIKFLMHGRGLGDDAPIYVFDASKDVRAQIIEANTVFVVKPVVKPANAWHPLVCWGDSVVVTDRGAQRLGSLSLGIEVIE